MRTTVANNPSRPYWTWKRTALWALLAAIALWLHGRDWAEAFYPKEGRFYDFCQEWLSARNWYTGRPVYSPQLEVFTVHTGYTPNRASDMLPWNAHPPAAVLLALPFSLLDYSKAHFAWNILTVPLFLACVIIVMRELPIRWHWASLLPAIALGAFCVPLLSHFSLGQLNIVLLFLTMLAWRANRRDRQFLAGCFMGVAAAVKLFPVFLLVFWIAPGRRRGLAGGLAAFCLVNLLCLTLFGAKAFITYITVVIPSTSTMYRSAWSNVSWPSLAMKLFYPARANDSVPVVESPAAAYLLALGGQAVITLLIAWRSWRARTIEQRDWTMALALTGMLLVSPITWTSYCVLLLLPLTMLWNAPMNALRKGLLAAATFILWVPLQWFMLIPMGREVTRSWRGVIQDLPPATPWQTIFGLSLPTFALIILFYLAWRLYPKPPAVQNSEPPNNGC